MGIKQHWIGSVVALCAAFVYVVDTGAQRGGETAPPKSEEARALIASAMALAKDDLVKEAQVACSPAGPSNTARAVRGQGLKQVEPIRVFDNLYFLGFEEIGAWAVDTGDGIVLVDTLNSPDEAEKVLVPGLRKLGADASQIKHVILSHGHTDHFGGAPFLQKQYGARIWMTAADWDFIARPAATAAAAPNPPALPDRDMNIADGSTLTLGNTTFTFGIMPGHTPGTIMMTFPVNDRGTRRTVLFMGGALQVPNRASLQRFEHVMNAAKKAQPEMVFGSHPQTMGDGLAMMQRIRKNPNGPNPFVYGQERMARYIDIMVQCRTARVIDNESPASQPDIGGFWHAVPGGTYSIENMGLQGLQRVGENVNLGPRRSRIVDPPDGNIPYQRWAGAKAKDILDNHRDPLPHQLDPQSRCWLQGVPRGMYQSESHFVQTPGQLVILHDYSHTYRVILLDDRPRIPEHMKLFMGESRGRWEGNTLVIETTNLNSIPWFDVVGSFHSDAMRVTERLTRVDEETIDYIVDIEDRKVYTRPWRMRFAMKRNTEPNWEQWEHACYEGERSVEGLLRRQSDPR